MRNESATRNQIEERIIRTIQQHEDIGLTRDLRNGNIDLSYEVSI
jgi:hypothetical protein